MSDADSGRVDGGLTETEQAMLDFEATWRRSGRPKDDQIRALFGLSTPRYYQRLNALLDNPAALAHDPVLVQRLRRLREKRQAARSASRVTPLR